uniref:Ovarian tumor-like cysteine protease n=1 Tax=Clandestinovirus TaxID=2831644 RepID=A0A8F8KRD4_9VIRU|nr:ovarian tumor-like cysteine protease [Clandestinovirus]
MDRAEANLCTFLEVHPMDVMVLPNPGGGDCLFYALAQAFCNIVQNPNQQLNDRVLQLRKIVANAFTDDMFAAYKFVYDEAKVRYTQAVAKRDTVSRDLSSYEIRRCQFAARCKTVSEARKKMMTSEYWGDETAISILQQVLRIGIIVINNRAERKDGMLEMQLFDVKETIQNAKHYIILFLSDDNYGSHYRLVSLQSTCQWSFQHLPNALKHLIQQRVIAIKPDESSIRTLSNAGLQSINKSTKQKEEKLLEKTKREVVKRYPDPKFFLHSSAVPMVTQRVPFKRNVQYGRTGKPVNGVGKYLPTKTVSKSVGLVNVPTVVRSTNIRHK